MSDAMLAIMMIEARSGVEQADTLEKKLKSAMSSTRDHWMCLDEDQQFRAAIGAVLSDYNEDSDDRKRLESEVKAISQMNAFFQASSSGLSVAFPELDDEFEPIGLMKMWKEKQNEH